jgi:hypothetical protein
MTVSSMHVLVFVALMAVSVILGVYIGEKLQLIN